MQARYYDPNIARFISTDPLRKQSGALENFGRYIYADNNPISNLDLNGLETYKVIKMEDSKVNTIVTDGKGGIRVYLGNSDGMGRVVKQGVTNHEETHKSDFYSNCDMSCDVVKVDTAGLQVVVIGTAAGATAEVHASTVEINYLDGEKDKMRNQREKPQIDGRIKQMKDYRQANREILNSASPPPPPPPSPQPDEPRNQPGTPTP